MRCMLGVYASAGGGRERRAWIRETLNPQADFAKGRLFTCLFIYLSAGRFWLMIVMAVYTF